MRNELSRVSYGGMCRELLVLLDELLQPLIHKKALSKIKKYWAGRKLNKFWPAAKTIRQRRLKSPLLLSVGYLTG